MAEPAIERINLPRLTALRAFAALAVFLFHVGRDLQWTPAQKLFSEGYVGVGFFFVLSGFVLTWSARPRQRPGDVYYRRFARVYPLYVVTLVLGAIYVTTQHHFSVNAMLLAVVLLQAWTADITLAFGINGPAWSLSCEAFFYALFPFLLVFALRRHRAAAAITAVWLVIALTVTWALTGGSQEAGVVALVDPLLRCAEFCLGIVVAIAVQRGWVPPVRLGTAVLALAAGLVGCRVAHVPLPVPSTLLTPLFALVIAAAATADLQNISGWLPSRQLVYFGEISFAFYLIHSTVISTLSHMPKVPAVVISLAVSVLASAALHHLVETPARKRLLAPRIARA